MTPDNISFELSLGEMASGARVNRVRAPNGPRNSGGRAAQFTVMFLEDTRLAIGLTVESPSFSPEEISASLIGVFGVHFLQGLQEMAEHKSQHYVPRSYLARFCAETADPQQEPYVWVFSREKGRVFRRSPKKTATRSYYYSFTSDEGQLDHEIEEHLGVVESKAASIIDRLVAGGSPEVLTPDDRANLSYFIAYMGHRVPSFRSHWEEQLGKIGEMMGKTAASNKDYFHRFITEHMEKGDIESDIDVEELREFILSDKYELRGHPFQSLRLMVELTKTVAEIVFSFQWRLLRNATSFPLFTSDAPLSLVTTEKLLPPFNLGVGWRSPFMEALLPLSPTTALMISQHHPEGQESATPRQVLEANLRTQAYAQNEVYSSSPNIGAHLQLPRDWQWWVPLSSEVDPELED